MKRMDKIHHVTVQTDYTVLHLSLISFNTGPKILSDLSHTAQEEEPSSLVINIPQTERQRLGFHHLPMSLSFFCLPLGRCPNNRCSTILSRHLNHYVFACVWDQKPHPLSFYMSVLPTRPQ